MGNWPEFPNAAGAMDTTVVYHLQQLSGNSGWKVNGTRLFGSFQWKISGSNGTSEKPVLFFRMECSKRKSCTICSNLIFDTSFRLSRPFSVQQQLINGKENDTFKMTSQSLKLLGDYSDSFNL